MTIEADIIAWALDRQAWQQEVLVDLANGVEFDDAKIKTLADKVLESKPEERSGAAKSISLRSSAVEQVQLKEITNTEGVNALAAGQTLGFASGGMTIVYGDNGSGKSGYARLIKRMVSARHSAEILPDVFSEEPADPKATLNYTVAGTERSQVYPDTPGIELLKMSFYDEHCGKEYLTKQSTISYRPSALVLLDGLIQVCDAVRDELQSRTMTLQAQSFAPDIPPQTTAGAFIASLTSKTTTEQVDKATLLAPGADQELSAAMGEVARLTTSNADKEQSRLNRASLQLSDLRSTLSSLLELLSKQNLDALEGLKKRAAELRVAANTAATKSFDGEPLSGVGSGAWRALWEAARNYSITEAYHDHDFPATATGSRCVLCHQDLGEEAVGRLERFNNYMTDTTERDAVNAEQAYEQALQRLEQLVISTPQVLLSTSALIAEDAKLGNLAQTLLDRLETQRTAVLAFLKDGGDEPASLPDLDILEKIANVAAELAQRAAKTDVEQFKKDLAAANRRRDELEANIQISKLGNRLKSEIERLQRLSALSTAKGAVDTTAITLKSSQLTRQYATALILDQFTREAERLKLQRVTLEDRGGKKGQLNQMPGLLGAKHQLANARSVLSEGEQTALGLAGFFTEAMLDDSRSAIIFDDPVTSLDHVRRDYVAARLAELAKDRQVIVFSHDVAFAGDLMKAADHEGVEVAQRSVERRGQIPGACLEVFPWKAKDFRSRVDTLRTCLATIAKDRGTMLQSDYETKVAEWAGYLSETWERSVSTEIINQVFERGKSEVRVQKFRLFAQITDDDDKDFQEGYGQTSKWARRHDKAPETNYVAPEPAEMEKELTRIVDWQKRIKGYLNS